MALKRPRLHASASPPVKGAPSFPLTRGGPVEAGSVVIVHAKAWPDSPVPTAHESRLPVGALS